MPCSLETLVCAALGRATPYSTRVRTHLSPRGVYDPTGWHGGSTWILTPTSAALIEVHRIEIEQGRREL